MDRRFYSLDAMRGVAALAVVIFHVADTMHLHIVPYAYLAVDFFFMLSGFVLARAYETKLDTSLSAKRFIQMRAIRLYPLFGLGVLIGATVALGHTIAKSPHALSPPTLFAASAANLAMLPSPVSTVLFPMNVPGWSLFFELVINVLFAVFLCKLPSRFLAAVGAIAGLAFFFWITQVGKSDIGADWPNLFAGILRVSFSFPLGILMARCFRLKVRYRSPAALLIIAALAALLMLDPHVRREWLYDSAAIFLVIPAILWAGAIIELPKSLEKIGAILGDISFPVYAVHAPLLQASNYVLIRILRLSNFAAAITFVISVFLLSWILAIQFDAPVRKWLSGKLHLRPTALPVE